MATIDSIMEQVDELIGDSDSMSKQDAYDLLQELNDAIYMKMEAIEADIRNA